MVDCFGSKLYAQCLDDLALGFYPEGSGGSGGSALKSKRHSRSNATPKKNEDGASQKPEKSAEVFAKLTKFRVLKNIPMCRGQMGALNGKGPFIVNALLRLH